MFMTLMEARQDRVSLVRTKLAILKKPQIKMNERLKPMKDDQDDCSKKRRLEVPAEGEEGAFWS